MFRPSGVLLIGLLWAPLAQAAPEPPWARSGERAKMVEKQLVARGISDPKVLSAMRWVPRHMLVPEDQRRRAYSDQPLPIGHAQTISQPYVVAFMTQQLRLKPHHRVLEVGTGSGYQAAVLAHLVDRVYTIEIVAPLAERAKKDLARLGYDNIEVITGDGYRGLPKKAPFDAIIVTAAPPQIPKPLMEQLAIGGRMIVPVGEGVQELVSIQRTKTGFEKENVLPVRFVPMTGRAQKQGD